MMVGRRVTVLPSCIDSSSACSVSGVCICSDKIGKDDGVSIIIGGIDSETCKVDEVGKVDFEGGISLNVLGVH